jgi:hypothetical protein
MSKGHTHVITPVSTLFIVFGTLFVLTILTVLAAKQDFGALNTPIALGIAVLKGLAGRHLLHGGPLQHAADKGRRGRRLLLAAHHVRIDDGRLPVATAARSSRQVEERRERTELPGSRRYSPIEVTAGRSPV